MTDHADHKQAGVAAAIAVQSDGVLMIRRRVPEGQLLWQFPAGQIEPRESPEQAAVRETLEETGMYVTALKLLGERVHPKTGRRMSYVACAVESGTPYVADDAEVAEVAWVRLAQIPAYVPYGLFDPVQTYLDATLSQ
ncbi:NUDIX hydrolase [Streptomyces sp. NPDC002589]|uniref:NUDIX hydrolase n=1 Tax=unclassified Streptomyces TaxID=2593676 RepID=UPI00332274E3